MGRAAVVLAGEGIRHRTRGHHNHPDKAGLIGAVHLAPSWVLAGHDAILAADIGGTNLRVGVVELNMKKGDLSKAAVWKYLHWRHRDDAPGREEALRAHRGTMLEELIEKAAAEKLKLAPFVGIGCPGLIDEHGVIVRGGQNLPGQLGRQRLQSRRRARRPACRRIRGPRAGGRDPQRRRRAGPERSSAHDGRAALGRLTIGTGLGNARFTNRETD